MFPYFGKEVNYGSGQNVGVCCGWTPRSKYDYLLPHAHCVANLYSSFGVGVMIRNVLATPTIRVIVLVGRDHPEPARRLFDKLIHKQLDPDEISLDQEYIDIFYQRTRIVDCTWLSSDQENLLSYVQSYEREYNSTQHKFIPEAYYVSLPDPDITTYPTARSGHHIRTTGPTAIAQAHGNLVREILLFGDKTEPDKEGHYRKELWNLTVTLSDGVEPTSIPFYTDDEVQRYGMDLWYGTEPVETTYRYGWVLRDKYGDQVEMAKACFASKPRSFRTYLSLWEPGKSILLDDQPCLVAVHPIIRNGVMDMWACFRTNDMFKAWPLNAAGLCIFQQQFAQEMDVIPGDLTITSNSAHIYDYDLSKAQAYVDELKPYPLTFDPKGDWKFERDHDEMLVAYHFHEGQLLQTFREKTSDRLWRRIQTFVSDPGNAYWIGQELAKL